MAKLGMDGIDTFALPGFEWWDKFGPFSLPECSWRDKNLSTRAFFDCEKWTPFAIYTHPTPPLSSPLNSCQCLRLLFHRFGRFLCYFIFALKTTTHNSECLFNSCQFFATYFIASFQPNLFIVY